MADSTCRVSHCARPGRADDGLCPQHRFRLKKDGRLPRPRDERERILSRIDRDGPGGCWLWTGAADKKGTGYGCARYQGRNMGAHRAVWLLLRGPIPEGHELDHICEVRLCVNPDHLDPVQPRLNMQRVYTRPDESKCRRGHPRPDDWTVGVPCKPCRREDTARHRARKRSAA